MQGCRPVPLCEAGEERRDAGRRPLVPGVLALALTSVAMVGCLSAPISSRDRELRRQPPPHSLPIPVAGVAKTQLRDSYGDPRSGGRRHEGIDIFAARSTPVLSASEGYVSGVGRNGLGGNVVWVTGPGGWRHYYAHLDRWGDVREGQWVAPGTILGYVGNSGNARTTPPHLHYGIYPASGGTINPYPLLAAGPGAAVARHPGAEPAPTPRPARGGSSAEEVARRSVRDLGLRVLRDVLEEVAGGN